uniref:Beta-fructofuranosidase, insoluble isoenzyme CWINV6-like n=1 Tax=Tanacetum cinerariifolium TaxID=118510 RepID=A0A6L2MQD1_TANCI|nr:beta-fructofuranosidase, insoluble isoenzyme CWINV6-like [Tanacetum cinerariifolium]
MKLDGVVGNGEKQATKENKDSKVGFLTRLFDSADSTLGKADVTISFKLEDFKEVAVLDAISVDPQALCIKRGASSKGVFQILSSLALASKDLEERNAAFFRPIVRNNIDTTSFSAFSVAWRWEQCYFTNDAKPSEIPTTTTHQVEALYRWANELIQRPPYCIGRLQQTTNLRKKSLGNGFSHEQDLPRGEHTYGFMFFNEHGSGHITKNELEEARNKFLTDGAPRGK